MKYELKEISLEMGKLEYEMYQEIPSKEAGSVNLCHGLPFEVFSNYLETLINNKHSKVNYYGTPTITYIFYVNDFPVGYVGIRTELDENWKKWCGNIYYVVRPSERNKGYGTKILECAIGKCKELGFSEILTQSSEGNIASQKVIENNNGVLLREDGTRYYKINL
jgi:Predicted acetyltransferase